MKFFLDSYDIFIFDLDGLLVNTEEVHFRAYERVCQKRGYQLGWDFISFSKMAHYGSTAVRDFFYETISPMGDELPSWNTIHQEKTAEFLFLIENQRVGWMPGAHHFLNEVLLAGKKTAVVTNSLLPIVKAIRSHLPLLNQIPLWFTREDYQNSKPAPDGYLQALTNFEPAGRTVGFEDTPRGVEALLKTSIQPILISSLSHIDLSSFNQRGVLCFSSFEKLIPTIDDFYEKKPLRRRC